VSGRWWIATLIASAALATPASASAAAGLTPGPQSPIPIPGSPSGVISADFSGDDGNPDLAVLDPSAKTVTTWSNLDNGNWLKRDVLTTGNSPQAMAAGDFNGDGDLDIAVTNLSDGTISLFTGSGSAFFADAGTVPAGTTPNGIAVGQFDAGTDPDIAVTSAGTDTVAILTGTGVSAATFSAPVAINMGTGTDPRDIVVGRFNGDSDPDLAVSESGTDDTRILNGGTGTTFALGPALDTTKTGPRSLAVADLNADGRDELAVGHTNSGNIGLFVNGTSGFGAVQLFTTETSPVDIALEDLDGDAHPELMAIVHFTTVDRLDVRQGTAAAPFFASTIGVMEVPDDARGVTAFRDQDTINRADAQVVTVSDNTAPDSSTGALASFQNSDYGLAVTAGTLDTVEVGKISTAAQRVTVTNTGFAAFTPLSIVMTGSANEYIVVNDTCTGLAFKSTCTFDVRFAPTFTGTRTATVSVKDTLSRTAIAATSGPAGAQGAKGDKGDQGDQGPVGPATAGAPGATGADGAQGPKGDQGAAGSQGAQGPAGPKGPAGRDAKVTCKAAKAKRGKVKVTCSVKLVKSARVTARLTRGHTIYASGTARNSGSVALKVRRQMPAGRYRLTTASTDSSGARVIRRTIVTVAE
jgi:hypothetical protein